MQNFFLLFLTLDFGLALSQHSLSQSKNIVQTSTLLGFADGGYLNKGPGKTTYTFSVTFRFRFRPFSVVPAGREGVGQALPNVIR